MHHLCLGFTCIALFLYPSCNFAVISLIVFTHNMHTLCCIGYSTWLKNWLINFWAMYFLVYALFFFMCKLYKIFFLRDMMDNQCANIFSTHATVYGSHSVKFAFIKIDNIFLHVYSQLIFLSLVCVFLFIPTPPPPPPLFFPKTVFPKNYFIFPCFYRGRNFF